MRVAVVAVAAGVISGCATKKSWFTDGFFSSWDSLGALQIAELGDLAADGHDIEAHGLDHLDASTYADGPAAYFDHEVAPEIAKLEAAGFPISTFAYPFGAHTIETNAPILD